MRLCDAVSVAANYFLAAFLAAGAAGAAAFLAAPFLAAGAASAAGAGSWLPLSSAMMATTTCGSTSVFTQVGVGDRSRGARHPSPGSRRPDQWYLADRVANR